MNVQLLTQKYEEIRWAKSVTGYEAELKKVIIEQGMASFVLYHNPRTTQEPIYAPSITDSFLEKGKVKVVELLSTIISNIIIKEAVV